MLTRRQFIRNGALLTGAGLALGGTGILSACGSDSSPSSAGADSTSGFGSLPYQLGWVKEVGSAGAYLADTNGYYTQAGFDSVDLISGGPSVQVDTVVAAGKAFVTTSQPDVTAAAILAGTPLVIAGARFQKNPYCVLSLTETGITGPKDLVGKSVGVDAFSEPVWATFLAANDIDPASISKVPVQFDPTPLAAGEIDALLGFFTNEPNQLRAQGYDVATFLLDDFNYPLVSQTYTFLRDVYENEPERVKAFLKAEVMGWRDSLADPDAGAKLAVDVYGKDLGLTLSEQEPVSRDQNTLILTDDTRVNGIFTLTPERISEVMTTLTGGGLQVQEDQLFDLTLLEEMYAENLDLKIATTGATG